MKLITHDGLLYQIQRFFRTESVKSEDAIHSWLGTDLAIKHGDYTFFCSSIQDVEYEMI